LTTDAERLATKNAKRFAWFCVIVLASTCLLIRAARVGIDGDYLDPVSRITAQDESFFVNSVIGMARHGDWLTPRYMGRYSFYKPPLFMWISAASARMLGISRFTVRLPLALLCGLAVGMVYLIGVRNRSWQTGAAAGVLLISNHLWNVTGAMVLTDALLAAFDIAAMYCLFTDPSLQSEIAFWGFAASVAGAILTKTVAGALPLAAFGLYWLFAARDRRASFGRVCGVFVVSIALAAPWYAYQLIVHHRWFWTEHVLTQILGYGGGAPPQTTNETHLVFYLKRMVLMDPILPALLLIAIPSLIVALKKRSLEALLMLCWLAPSLAAPLAWHYRTVTYLIPALPPMAVAAASYSPTGKRWSYAILAVAIAGFACKVAFPRQTWGLSFARTTVQPASTPLRNYCELNRGNELISVDVADDLYASVLPLPHLRYALVSPSMTGGTFSLLDFTGMGISVTVDDFNHLETRLPSFRQTLRQWDLNSAEPIATLIVAANQGQLMSLVRSHPLSDFLFPANYRTQVTAARFPAHLMVDAGPDFFLLLAGHRLARAVPPAWPCEM
jgi:hypothetical protein